jgi:mRNA-degrading endonuclease RelE of RelBE toxin-antitoxin system
MVTEAIGLARRDAETAVRGKRGRLALQRADQVLALEARKKTENAEADRKLAELRAQEDERLAEAEKAAKEQSEKDRLERHKANEWARNQAPASPAPAPVIAPEAGLLEPKATGLAVTAIRWHKNARKTWKKLDPALKPLIRTAISKVKEDGLDLGNTLTKPVKDTNNTVFSIRVGGGTSKYRLLYIRTAPTELLICAITETRKESPAAFDQAVIDTRKIAEERML